VLDELEAILSQENRFNKRNVFMNFISFFIGELLAFVMCASGDAVLRS
jgi:hypothetical protein